MTNTATATEVQAPKKMTQLEGFKHSISKMETEFKKVLPPNVTAEKFIRVVTTAVQKNPELLNAEKYDQKSLFMACTLAATDGLLPDGRESALVPFKGKVNYLPMVTGILKKIRNSGELGSIAAHNVFENDQFKYYVDEKGEHLYHERNFKNPGACILTYCLAITKDSNIYLEVMTTSEIEDVRKRSASGNSGPWVSDRGEMNKKTVLKRLSKRLPMSTDIEDSFERDQDYIETTGRPVEVTIPPEQTQQTEQVVKAASKLKEAMQIKSASAIVVQSKPVEQTEAVPIDNGEEVPI
jgi:recombination protein RecT